MSLSPHLSVRDAFKIDAPHWLYRSAALRRVSHVEQKGASRLGSRASRLSCTFKAWNSDDASREIANQETSLGAAFTGSNCSQGHAREAFTRINVNVALWSGNKKYNVTRPEGNRERCRGNNRRRKRRV